MTTGLRCLPFKYILMRINLCHGLFIYKKPCCALYVLVVAIRTSEQSIWNEKNDSPATVQANLGNKLRLNQESATEKGKFQLQT